MNYLKTALVGERCLDVYQIGCYRCKNQWWCWHIVRALFIHLRVCVLNKLIFEHIVCAPGFPPQYIVVPHLWPKHAQNTFSLYSNSWVSLPTLSFMSSLPVDSSFKGRTPNKPLWNQTWNLNEIKINSKEGMLVTLENCLQRPHRYIHQK